MNEFSHLDPQGNPTMVNISEKTITRRTARARSVVVLNEEIMKHLNGNDIQTKKGPVFQTAIIAGTMAAKRTADLIPLCHPLGLDSCKLTVITKGLDVIIECLTEVEAKTGIEMEALTGVSVAALTVYDMCKAFSHDIVIKEIRLIEKTGGKSHYEANTSLQDNA